MFTTTPSMFVLLTLSLAHLVHSQYYQPGGNQPLNGLVVTRTPFAERNKSGNFTGYYADLMDEIARIGEFNYTFKETLVPRSSYSEKPESIIEEFLQRSMPRNDFVIADFLFSGTSRVSEIEFTEPYHTAGLSIIIHKDRIKEYNINSFGDLLVRDRPRPTTTDGRQLDELALGTVRSGITYQQLSMNSDDSTRELYKIILPNPSNFVDSRENGVRRALSSPYAFLQEAIHNEIAVDEHCELKQFSVPTKEGPGNVLPFKYSIAMRKNSPHLEKFNKGIRELKANGKLDEIKRRYFNRKCNSTDSFHHIAKTILSISCIFLSMTISNFLIA